MSGQPQSLARRDLFGLAFVDAPDLDDVVADLVDRVGDPPAGQLPVVVTPNVDHLVKLDKGLDPTAGDIARRARWVLPDGQPIVWASRILGRPLHGRLAGSSLVAALFPLLVDARRSVLVVATSDAVASRVEAEGDHCHALVAPVLSLRDRGSFDEFVDLCAARTREVRPEHVFVTLGFPKQCNIIDGLVRRLEPGEMPVMLAVGASFDMYYGMVRRAPGWMQRWGLEWLFRFVQEPRRLFRRYFVDDPAFLALLWREWRAGRQPSSERRRDRRRFEA